MNKIVIILAAALLASAGVYAFIQYRNHHKTNPDVSPTAIQAAFEQYKAKHNINWGKTENDKRLKVFTVNYMIVANHPKTSSYKLGLTSLAHLTREEFAALKLGFRGKNSTGAATGPIKKGANDEVTVDWSAKGAVTPIKDQGQCGSCWAFSTTGSLEGLNFIKNGKLVSLSEQELVDCSSSYGNYGCNGGLMDNGFKYVTENGIASEESYPYTATDGTCQSQPKVFRNKGHTDVNVDDDKALGDAVTGQPVSVAIEADTSDFQLYDGGVITGDACGTQLDHGVLAVGYGVQDGTAYFKVKNSWGESWGLSGYVLIGRADGAGVCGINSAASFPTL